MFMLDMKNSLRDLLRPFASKFLISRGIAVGTESSLSLLWSGPSEHLAYFQRRFFSKGTATQSHIGRRPIYMLQNMLDGAEPSIAAVILNHRMATEIGRPDDFVMPLWVESRVDLAGERDYAKSKSLSADLRNIQKNELEWNTSKSKKDLETFYDRFYTPTITASHGRAALLANKAERFKLFSSGKMDLLHVKRGAEVIAAVTIDYREEEPVLRDSGVLDGSAALKKCGAVAALYLYSMDYLASKGYRNVGLGLTRSFLDDGVLAFKRKFRPLVRPGFDQCLLIRTGALNRITRTILRSSPCFTWQGHELHRTYFRDAVPGLSSPNGPKNGNSWNFGIDKESIFDISGETIRRQTGQQEFAKVS